MLQALPEFALLENDLRHACPHSRMTSHFHDPQEEKSKGHGFISELATIFRSHRHSEAE